MVAGDLSANLEELGEYSSELFDFETFKKSFKESRKT
jgi:hypothetical protein